MMTKCKKCGKPITDEIHAYGLTLIWSEDADPTDPIDCFYHRGCCPINHNE